MFAPTGEAFAAVEGLDVIIKDTNALRTLLLNHVVDGNVLSTNLSNGLSVEPLGGESLNVKISADGSIILNNAKVVISELKHPTVSLTLFAQCCLVKLTIPSLILIKQTAHS